MAAEQFDLFSSPPPAGIQTLPSAVNAVAPEVTAVSATQFAKVAKEGIQDAGAELVANRRNRARQGMTWADLATLNPALRVNESVKAKIWPKPDYKALIDGGMEASIAHIVKQVYDGVGAKPAMGRGDINSEANLEAYANMLNRVERGLMEWVSDPTGMREWVQKNARHAGARLGQRVSLIEIAADSSKKLIDFVFPDGWKNHRMDLHAAGGNRLLSALQPGMDELMRAMKAVDGGWPEKREAWQIQGYKVKDRSALEIRISEWHRSEGDASIPRYSIIVDGWQYHSESYGSRSEAEEIIKGFGAVALMNKRGRIQDFFINEEAAINSAREKTTRTGTTISDKGERVDGVERLGPERRVDGEDISSQQLMDTFGFKGVNFGNWMKTPSARAEAQLHLNHAYDSLFDLAEIMNVPPRALTFGGMLGLAIGAQGSGQYAAHFVPGVNEINLTRTSGAGSLAHEWAHALDHYLATTAGLANDSEPFLSEHVMLPALKSVHELVGNRMESRKVPRFGDGISQDAISAMANVVARMDKRDQTPEELAAGVHERTAKAERGRESWLRSIKQNFAGPQEEFDKLADRMRNGDIGDGKISVGATAFLSPVVVEMRELHKLHSGRLYSLDDSKMLQNYLDHVSFQKGQTMDQDAPVAQVATRYALDARELDADKGGKQYFSLPCEKFARAFDAYVSDEMTARGITNGYLSHQGRGGRTVPGGEERERINDAFQGVVKEASKAMMRTFAKEQLVRDGLHIGEILAVEHGLAKQRTGRDGKFVYHDTNHLAVSVSVGQVVSVKYDGAGHGVVSGKEKGLER